jgi:hypothetical protein
VAQTLLSAPASFVHDSTEREKFDKSHQRCRPQPKEIFIERFSDHQITRSPDHPITRDHPILTSPHLRASVVDFAFP